MTLYNKTNGNRIDLIVCDGDGTLIDYPESPSKSSWDFVGHVYCDKNKWQPIADRCLALIRATKDREEQEKIFVNWALASAEALKGHNPELTKERPIPYGPGVHEYFSGMNGEQRAIISGGLDLVFGRIADELEFQHKFMNSLGTKEGRFDGTVKLEVRLYNKLPLLVELTNRTGISAENVLVIGDGFNDIPMFYHVRQAGGIALAMGIKEQEVINAADAAITDFREIEKYTYRK